MGVVLLVKGTIQYGRLKEYSDTIGAFVEYRRNQGWAIPEVLYGLAGPMNSVLLIFRYRDLGTYEKEMMEAHNDVDYARIASKSPYADGSILYELYHDQDG